ncbi:hypothetical protein J7E73_00970 [Paenibacillus albidus]|uniref:hypothetical protein n=1 Tax=Paenibacillus albidus TaxID=2041023 RepID=UPI001BE52AFB|nr:hypothetical protein [Paenibacillus albidus]MBT2287717.1 hypothetical protein [Paenibacillus albidus]
MLQQHDNYVLGAAFVKSHNEAIRRIKASFAKAELQTDQNMSSSGELVLQTLSQLPVITPDPNTLEELQTMSDRIHETLKEFAPYLTPASPDSID